MEPRCRRLSSGGRGGSKVKVRPVAGSPLTTWAITVRSGAVHGPLVLYGRQPGERSLLQAVLTSLGTGTDEILTNIIAERVLGLPADVRVDKDKAFSEL